MRSSSRTVFLTTRLYANTLARVANPDEEMAHLATVVRLSYESVDRPAPI